MSVEVLEARVADLERRVGLCEQSHVDTRVEFTAIRQDLAKILASQAAMNVWLRVGAALAAGVGAPVVAFVVRELLS